MRTSGTTAITIPTEFAENTISREGEAGRKWLESLPDLVESLCRRWELTLNGAPMHGGIGLVLPALRGAEPCVLKVGWRDSTTVDEAKALAHWDGRGAVRLLDAEPSLGALVLERLDSTRSLHDVPLPDAAVIAGRLLRRLAVPAPPGFRSLSAVASEVSGSLPNLWERCGRPLHRRVLDRARGLAADLAPSAADLLVNYDFFYRDVLLGTREPWLAVDPKVVVGDVEYGLAPLLWARLDEIESLGGLDRFFPLLVEAAELDPERARDWSVVRCVDYWLWGLSIGLTYDPERCRRIVDWLLPRRQI
jgi:streptomycin 6-kinase